MPYTLMKGLVWLLIALLLGVVLGWLLRSIAASRQLRQVRSATVDNSELDRLRARVANLEPLVAERDRITSELADHRGRHLVATAAGVEAADESSDESDESSDESDESSDLDPGEAAEDVKASDVIADDVTADGPAAGLATAADEAGDTPTADPPNPVAEAADEMQVDAEPEAVQGFAAVADESADVAAPDLAAAAAVLGKKIKLDDLTAIEGVGPAIAGLCAGIGIHTWAELAATEVSLLRTMLTDAGSRFSVHEPDSWPDQARLLAAGQWVEFVELTDRLDGGRVVD